MATQRLPIPGSDNGTWGSILNGFLEVSHNADGTLIPSALTAAGALTQSVANGLYAPTGAYASLTATSPQTMAGTLVAPIEDAGGQVFNVMAYGAKGNLIVSSTSDGHLTSGTRAFSSATASFVSTDVGKIITIANAGGSGTPLNTTITGFTSSTAVTLAASASASVSAAAYSYGTDDTTAIQSAVNAAMPNGGIVYFPPPLTSYLTSQILIDYSAQAGASSGVPYGYSAPVLMGTGRRSLITQSWLAANGTPLIRANGHTGSSAGPASNFKLTGLVIEKLELRGQYNGGPSGNPSGVAGGDGIQLETVFDYSIRDVLIRQMTGNGVNVVRNYFSSGVADEYSYDGNIDRVRCVANGGWGFQLGSNGATDGGTSAGAAVTAHPRTCDATGNVLGGFIFCSASSVATSCFSGGNGGPGFQSVWTNQTISASNTPISNATDLTLVGCHSEGNGTQGMAEISIVGGHATNLVGCYVLASLGAHCIGFGNGSTGYNLQRVLITGGYYAGDSSTVGQLFFQEFYGSALTSALTNGTPYTSLTLKQAVTLNSGTVLTLNNGTTTATVTLSSAVSNSATIPINSFTPSATFPSGSSAYAPISDGQNPAAICPRIDYTTFAPGPGGRNLPNLMVASNAFSWQDNQNIIFNATGYLTFPRAIVPPANAPGSGQVTFYTKAVNSSYTQLATRLGSGAEITLATEGQSTVNPNFPLPTYYGYQGWTFPNLLAVGSPGTTPFTSGTVYAFRINGLIPGNTLTQVTFYVTSAGSALTAGGNSLAVFDPVSGTLLFSTADLTTNFQSTGIVRAALTQNGSNVIGSTGAVLVAILSYGASSPTIPKFLSSSSNPSASVINSTATGSLATSALIGVTGPATQTTMPGSLTISSLTSYANAMPWLAVS